MELNVFLGVVNFTPVVGMIFFFLRGRGGDGLLRCLDMSCFFLILVGVGGGGKVFERCIISFIMHDVWVYIKLYLKGVSMLRTKLHDL